MGGAPPDAMVAMPRAAACRQKSCRARRGRSALPAHGGCGRGVSFWAGSAVLVSAAERDKDLQRHAYVKAIS